MSRPSKDKQFLKYSIFTFSIYPWFFLFYLFFLILNPYITAVVQRILLNFADIRSSPHLLPVLIFSRDDASETRWCDFSSRKCLSRTWIKNVLVDRKKMYSSVISFILIKLIRIFFCVCTFLLLFLLSFSQCKHIFSSFEIVQINLLLNRILQLLCYNFHLNVLQTSYLKIPWKKITHFYLISLIFSKK